MIVNCQSLGLDWREASLSEYWEAIEAHSDANPATKPGPDLEVLKRFSQARAH